MYYVLRETFYFDKAIYLCCILETMTEIINDFEAGFVLWNSQQIIAQKRLIHYDHGVL